MIKLPDFNKSFEYENDFYLSCDSSRIGKFIAHYELYNKTKHLPGVIVEAGVFKGVALVRFAMMEKNINPNNPRKIIGFDTFSDFPETDFEGDKQPREKFIKEAGLKSISKSQLEEVLKNKGIDFVELVEGDILKTVPEYMKSHPDFPISLINLDVDIYEPSKIILDYLYPNLLPGGIFILDDYGRFPGETKAVDDYFKNKNIKIERFSFCKTPCYIIKK